MYPNNSTTYVARRRLLEHPHVGWEVGACGRDRRQRLAEEARALHQLSLQVCHDQVHRDAVRRARHDDVGVSGRRQHKVFLDALVRLQFGCSVLTNDGFTHLRYWFSTPSTSRPLFAIRVRAYRKSYPPFHDISLDSARKHHVRIALHKYFHVEKVAQRRISLQSVRGAWSLDSTYQH